MLRPSTDILILTDGSGIPRKSSVLIIALAFSMNKSSVGLGCHVCVVNYEEVDETVVWFFCFVVTAYED